MEFYLDNIALISRYFNFGGEFINNMEYAIFLYYIEKVAEYIENNANWRV